ncbi:MAG: lysylphosphatidylglycerol synthase transmembrane domain-containing protein [Gammaproteobacteria bacterium]|nr:lysylphosphatidylglycerol synthase transmembrane domain-containing protein [Gammaproteobacteria bacterium]
MIHPHEHHHGRDSDAEPRNPEDPGGSGWRRWLGRLLRILLVAVCIAYAVWNVDPTALARTLGGIDPLRVTLVTLFTGLGYIALAFRLRHLSHHRLPLGTGLAASLVALGVNNLLPAKLGEVAKALYLRERGAMPFSESVVIVGWERFFDLNVLVLMALAGASSYLDPSLLAPAVVALLVAWGMAWGVIRFATPVRSAIARLPSSRLRAFLHDVHAHLDTRMVRGTLLGTAVLSVVVWLLYAGGFWLVLAWIFELRLTTAEILVVFVVAASGMALPSSPGALGVYEAAIVLALGWFGVAREQALAAALVMHAIQYLPTTLLALGVLARSRIRLDRLRPRSAGAWPAK